MWRDSHFVLTLLFFQLLFILCYCLSFSSIYLFIICLVHYDYSCDGEMVHVHDIFQCFVLKTSWYHLDILKLKNVWLCYMIFTWRYYTVCSCSDLVRAYTISLSLSHCTNLFLFLRLLPPSISQFLSVLVTFLVIETNYSMPKIKEGKVY